MPVVPEAEELFYTQAGEKEGKITKNKIIDIIISTVTTVIIVFVVMSVSSYFKSASLVDKPAVETTVPVVKETNTISSNSIAIPGYEKLVMKAGQVDQVVDFYNPAENECYFQITLSLADGTELFSSGMIKPGQEIGEIEINHSLNAGTYNDAVLQYECYALDSLQTLNGSKTILNLEVKQ